MNVDPRAQLAHHLDRAAVVLGDVLHDRQSRARCRPSRANEPDRRGRSARTPEGGRASGCPCRRRRRPAAPSRCRSSSDTVIDAAGRGCIGSRCRSGCGPSSERSRVEPETEAGARHRSSRASARPRGRASSKRSSLFADQRVEPHALAQLASRLQSRQVEQIGDDPRQAHRFPLELSGEPWDGGGIACRATETSVSAAAWIEAAGVFSSWEALATKSRRTASMRRVSVMSVTTSRIEPSLPGGGGRCPQPSRGLVAFELDRRRTTVLADLLDHLAQGRRIELSDGGRPPAEVALERFVREGGSPSTVEEQHAFLHRSQDQVLHLALVFAGALAAARGRRRNASPPRGGFACSWTAIRRPITKPAAATAIPPTITTTTAVPSMAAV